MADEPISALTLFTSYSTADEVEILDVSDTTMASTGTNKRIQFSQLLNMAPFVASGTGHIGGAVPDPGATAGTTHYLREDATWAVPAGGSPGGGSPGGSSGQIQYNSSSTFAGAATGRSGRPVSSPEMRSLIRVHPTRAISGSARPAATSRPSQRACPYRMAGSSGNRPRRDPRDSHVLNVNACGRFADRQPYISSEQPDGRKDNHLEHVRRLFWHQGSPTHTTKILLGGATIGYGTQTLANAETNQPFYGYVGSLQIQAIGSSGKAILGIHFVNMYGIGTLILGSTGVGTPPSQVTVNTTVSTTFDIQESFSASGNSIQLLTGWVRIDG